MAIGHVEERDDDAVDLVVDGPVRAITHEIPPALAASDLTLDRRQMIDHGLSVRRKAVVVELVGEVGDRPAGVGRRDIEKIGQSRCEALDAQARVQEQRAEIHRRYQVLQVAVGARHRVELELQLAVDGLQFLVDGLKFFLAGLELLRGGAVLLVDRLQLFIGGTELFIGRLGFFVCGPQARLGELELLLQLVYGFIDRLAGFARRCRDIIVHIALAFDEEDERALRLDVALSDRPDLHMDAVRRAVEADIDSGAERLLTGVENAMQQATELKAQLLAHEVGDVGGKGAAGRLKITSRGVGQVQRAVALIHENARWRGEFEAFAVGALRAPGRKRRRLRRCAALFGSGHTQQTGQTGKLVVRAACRLIEARLAIDDAEQPVIVLGALRGTEEKIAVGIEAVMQRGQDLLLQVAVEIDEQVSAGNEV